MEGWWNIIRNNRAINNKKKKKKRGHSLIEVQLLFVIIIVLTSLQLVIVNHRYKELINREEIIGDYIKRENYIFEGELYIKKLIIDNNILSVEDFRNKINDYFRIQTFDKYKLEYERDSNRFVLSTLPTGAKYYYKISLVLMEPNLTEITY